MKKASLALVLFLGAAVLAAQASSVAFLGFDSGDISPSGLAILAQLVRHEISIAPHYELVERSGLEALLAEQELRLSDAFDPGKAPAIGRLAGADKLVAGTIGILGSLYIINLRMVDVASGKVERSQVEEYIGALEDLRKPVRIAAQKLLGIPGIEVNQGEFISVETDPPGVGVYVNGLFEGDSPLVVRVARPGKYAVKLAAEGYRPWTQGVSVDPSATYFVKAKLLKQEAAVDERIKALQDGRAGFLTFATAYAAATADAILFAFGSDNPRLYIGLPLVAAPLAFYAALKATDQAVMNRGRSFMITSSALWGSSWGLAASLAFGAVSEAGGEPPDLAAYAGLSVLGGLLYGSISTFLTAGSEPFPSSRAWLFNLGSALGAFLGLGVPYVLGVDDTGVIYASMLSGSLGGAGLALYLTRGYSEGRNIGNLSLGSLVDIGPEGLALGLPLIKPVASRAGERRSVEVPLVRLTF
jgi:hypothetical protein